MILNILHGRNALATKVLAEQFRIPSNVMCMIVVCRQNSFIAHSVVEGRWPNYIHLDMQSQSSVQYNTSIQPVDGGWSLSEAISPRPICSRHLGIAWSKWLPSINSSWPESLFSGSSYQRTSSSGLWIIMLQLLYTIVYVLPSVWGRTKTPGGG